MAPYFCYREAKNQQELEALLRLRYEVYRGSRLKGFCPENTWGLEMDFYDCHARHFGLFHCANSKERPVGYMRVIQKKETEMAAWVRDIARQHSMELLNKVCVELKNPFPSMSYFPDGDKVIRSVIIGDRNTTHYVCEGSRLIILPEFSSIRLGIHLIESAIAICLFCLGFQNAIVSCCESHCMIYKKRYFRELPCSGKTLLETDQPKIGALLLLPEFQKNASAELHERITRLAQAYSTHSCICFYPDRIGDYVPPLRHLVRSQKIPLKKIAGRVRISAVVV